MLKNAYLIAKIGADTAENEQHFAEVLPKTGNYLTGPVPIGIDAAAPPCGPECDRKCNFGFGKLRLGGSRVHPQVRLQAAKQGSRCIVSVHPFPSKHRGAGRASTQLLTMVCVGSVSLEFVLTKSDSDSENNAQHEKC